jgi:hypothetical protein
MMMRNFLTFIFLFGLSYSCIAQYNSCVVMVTAIIDNKPVVLKSSDALLLLNSKSGDLTLKINSNSLIAELDTMPPKLFPEDDYIIFTGNIQHNIVTLLNMQSNGGKPLTMFGTLSINSLSIATSASYNALKINNERDDLLRNLKMSVFVSFSATSAKLNKISPTISGDVLIQVLEGATNIVE